MFFSTDGQPVCIEEVQVSANASQGQPRFLETREQREEGHAWSVDGEFATGAIQAKAEAKRVTLNTPLRQVISPGRFPKTEWRYDAESDTATCPQGQTFSPPATVKKTGERPDRPAPGTGDGGPLREHCTASKTGRTGTRNREEAQWERQREPARTPEAVLGKVRRGILAEGKFAEAVRHGLKTMRDVGKQMAVLQRTLVACILNVKRLLRVEAQGVLISVVAGSACPGRMH